MFSYLKQKLLLMNLRFHERKSLVLFCLKMQLLRMVIAQPAPSTHFHLTQTILCTHLLSITHIMILGDCKVVTVIKILSSESCQHWISTFYLSLSLSYHLGVGGHEYNVPFQNNIFFTKFAWLKTIQQFHL